MRKYIDTLEQACTPTQLVTGLGLNSTKSGDQYTITCPACHNRLYLMEHGFLCASYDCTFRAGSPLDLLKISQKLDNYWEAVHAMENMYPDIYTHMSFRGERREMDGVVARLANRRSMYDFLLRTAQSSIDEHHAMATVNQLRAQADIDTEANSMTIFPVRKDSVEELEHIMRRYGVRDWPDLRGQNAFLLPYFTNHHTVGAMVYKKNVNDPPAKPKALEPSKFQFCGLMQADPRTSEYTLMSSYVRLLKKNSEFSHTSPSKLALHFLYNPKFPDRPWLPKEFTYIQQTHNEWSPLLMLARDVPLRVAQSSNFADVSIPFTDRILDVLVSKLINEGFNADTQQLISHAQLFDGLMDKVKNCLRESHQLQVLNALDTILQTRVLDFTPDGDKLLERDNSYYLERTGGGELNLSNFTIQFQKNIRFSDSPDVYHAVNLMFKGKEIPLLLLSQDLHNPRRLLDKVQQFPQKDIDINTLQGLPVLHELTTKPAAALMRYLRGRPGEDDMLTVWGISMLGWTPDRRQFFGPSFLANGEGISYGKKVFHPSNVLLQHFQSEKEVMRHVHDQLPLDCSNLIAQGIALIFRGFHGIQSMAVPMLREGGGEKLLREMFGALGQTHPLHFNDGQWARGKFTTGFPVYGTGATYWKTLNLNKPIFMLTERGQRVDEVFSPEVYDAAAQTFRQIAHECLEWMLAGQDTEFVFQRSVDPSCVLSKEGRRVIQMATGREWHVRTPSYQAIDTLLDHIPFERTREYMTFDLNKHRIELKLTGLPKVDAKDLELELRQNASDVVRTDTGIAANNADMELLMKTYYQDTPKFEEVFETPTDT